jgi:tetratricopeptide (TPR) repeat protein
MTKSASLLGWSTALLSACCAGCGDGRRFSLSYDRPARQEIAPHIRRLAVAGFHVAGSDDPQWGRLAADHLLAELRSANRTSRRFDRIDKAPPTAHLHPAADSDAPDPPSLPPELAASYDGLITGSVSVVTETERRTRTVASLSGGTRSEPYTYRFAGVQVVFHLIDLRNGGTEALVSLGDRYDSERDGPEAIRPRFAGPDGRQTLSARAKAEQLLARSTEQFAAWIVPRAVRTDVMLAAGSSEAVARGNRLARAGEYTEASGCYRQALDKHPDDHGAMYNLGLMHEARRRFADALDWYDRAIARQAEDDYIQARRRVRSLVPE